MNSGERKHFKTDTFKITDRISHGPAPIESKFAMAVGRVLFEVHD